MYKYMDFFAFCIYKYLRIPYSNIMMLPLDAPLAAQKCFVYICIYFTYCLTI